MKEKVLEIIKDIEKDLINLSDEIYENPELGNEEYKACALHTELLKKYGFEVESKYLDVDTAFKAVYESSKPGPTIAYLAEYDALPGIGHGCGHNMLGTVSTGAGIVLKKVIDEIGGKVIVFGTPAEETSGAKVLFADKGAFDDVDVALMAHPNNEYCQSGKSLAMQAIQFTYYGQTAHAAAAPDKGINALDAAINTFNNINALREHIRSDARVHGIIKEGGKAANIVPDYAVAQFYVRATTKKYLGELVEKVKNCARGASLAAGTKLEITNYEYSYDNLVTNQNLSKVFCEKLKSLGCNDMQEARESYGSLDAGNVSHCCPTIHPYFDITNDTNIVAHTVDMANATKTEYAYEQMRLTVGALALTGIEVIQNKELLEEVKKEFENAEK